MKAGRSGERASLFIASGMGSADGKVSVFSRRITVVSVALSFLVMAIALSVVSGFNAEIRRVMSGFAGDIYLTAPGSDIFMSGDPVDCPSCAADSIGRMKSVRSVSPFIYLPGVYRSGDRVEGLLLKGVSAGSDLEYVRSSVSEGSFPDFSASVPSSGIVVPASVAERNGLSVGDRMTVYFVSSSVKVRSLEISGIYDASLENIGEKLAFADIRMLQRILGWNDCVSGYEVRTDADPEIVFGEIADFLISSPAEADFVPGLAADMFSRIFEWLRLVDANMFFILVLMMAVAGFNMVSCLLIMLFERISMIGTLKSMGMGNVAIAEIFLVRSSSLVLKGMAWGNFLALAVLLVQSEFKVISLDPADYFLDHVPVETDPLQWIILNVVSYIAIMAFLAVPSVFIAGVDPSRTVVRK